MFLFVQLTVVKKEEQVNSFSKGIVFSVLKVVRSFLTFNSRCLARLIRF